MEIMSSEYIGAGYVPRVSTQGINRPIGCQRSSKRSFCRGSGERISCTNLDRKLNYPPTSRCHTASLAGDE